MQIELSKEQIDELFTFVEKKYVRYIDVQYELVDHLASGIEEEMTNDSSIDFRTALDKVYNRFPITGFDQFLTEKEKAMQKYWRRKQGDIFKQYFTLPKVFLTIMLLVLFGSLSLVNTDWSVGLMIFLNVSAMIYIFFVVFPKNNENTSRYLVLEKFYQMSTGLVFIPMCFLCLLYTSPSPRDS